MSENQQLPLSLQPVIRYPREAEVGKTYLMTIDLQTTGDFEWQYEEEEYPIYCMVDSSPLFSCKPVGEPAIVLHRFGGSYGEAKFLLTTSQEVMEGEIRVTLVNEWGVPVRVLVLEAWNRLESTYQITTNQVISSYLEAEGSTQSSLSLTFTFSLSQNQTFELRCSYGTRRLDTDALERLINLCEAKYYNKEFSDRFQLKNIGRELYQWLDGKEGWLQQALAEDSQTRIYLDLIQTTEAQALNPKIQKIALGLAHLPWELLHDGSGFLLAEGNVSLIRCVQQRENNFLGPQNRPLRLLFMAASPENSGMAPLQFEQEEANILAATKDQPLALVVEESGSVQELKNGFFCINPPMSRKMKNIKIIFRTGLYQIF
jgi:hypothetical protein